MDVLSLLAQATQDYYVHDLDPNLVELGPLKIRYYSLGYLLGLLWAWKFLAVQARKGRIGLTDEQVGDLIMPYTLLGVLVGGRLGYVLFYGLDEALANPLYVFKIWEGGMASHGGILGVVIALWLFGRKRGIPLLHLLDLGALTAPVGIFLVRITNFINGELWGRATEVPWAVIFHHPDGTPTEPRHPSQIYEAFGEGLLLWILALLLWRRLLPRTGSLAALFALGYSAARIVCEQFREPDAHIGFQILGTTRGQLLTLGLAAFGFYFLWTALRRSGPTWTPVEPTPPAGEPADSSKAGS